MRMTTKKFTSLACLLTALLGGCAANPPRSRAPSSAPADRAARITALIEEIAAKGAPGVIVRVIAPGTDVAEARGVFDRESGRAMRHDDLVRIASISKTFFGALAAILHVEGKINLHAPLGKTFPEVAARFTPRHEADGALRDPRLLTIDQMLGHRGGIADPIHPDETFFPYYVAQIAAGKPLEVSAALADIFQNGLLYTPWDRDGAGTPEYSNGGFILAASLVEKATRKPYWKSLREKILDPLGLRDTFNGTAESYDLARVAHGYNPMPLPGTDRVITDWQNVDQGNGLANGGLVSTVHDVAKFFRAIFQDPKFPAKVDRAAFLRTFLPNASTPASYGSRYANGIALDREGCFSHGGHFAGYVGSALHCPRLDLTIVLEVTTDEANVANLKDKTVCEIKKLWLPATACVAGPGG